MRTDGHSRFSTHSNPSGSINPFWKSKGCKLHKLHPIGAWPLPGPGQEIRLTKYKCGTSNQLNVSLPTQSKDLIPLVINRAEGFSQCSWKQVQINGSYYALW